MLTYNFHSLYIGLFILVVTPRMHLHAFYFISRMDSNGCLQVPLRPRSQADCAMGSRLGAELNGAPPLGRGGGEARLGFAGTGTGF